MIILSTLSISASGMTAERLRMDVVADNVQFLSGPRDGDGQSGAPGGGQQRSRAGARAGRDDVELNEEDFDDIPF